MRSKKRPTINDFVQNLNMGEKVFVNIQPNIKNQGYPYIRYQGTCGTIVGKRGDAYMVQVRDKKKQKVLLLKPVHLKKQKINMKTI